ncbi:Regulator of sigma S factor FliZ [Candidatus Syntrophocurvum alkaliphilum]|uniref:Flagellar protein n=1 Tax=Candidatus Syntrophocurvum alkaliphilum TaxID=2293317 RepID=A0A6I6DFE2_9FIRM|nr:flagellar biosynthetic protein FliO [Candidatus Syntrophocurvum alkaliphilum]QGT99178.1 Regulator of sigma S factor FliZ [Candidatus Syntrophocurvum alkaliphilum]
MFKLTNKSKLILGLLIIIFVFTNCDTSLAVDLSELNRELEQQDQTNIENQNLVLEFLKLIIVLGLIIGAAWSLVRLFSRYGNSKTQGTWINVVDEVMLGQNRGIVLCEVGGKIYAIGITDNNINMLFEVDNPKLLEDISENQAEDDLTNNKKFNDLNHKLRSFFGMEKLSVKSRKDFKNIMESHTKKLDELSNGSFNSGDIRGSRSNKDENS